MECSFIDRNTISTIIPTSHTRLMGHVGKKCRKTVKAEAREAWSKSVSFGNDEIAMLKNSQVLCLPAKVMHIMKPVNTIA